jgi:hypothetical protein
LKQESHEFVEFGSIHEACASMVNFKLCWIKANWTSRLHPYTYTSLLEHIGSIARRWNTWIRKLHFKRSFFRSLYFLQLLCDSCRSLNGDDSALWIEWFGVIFMKLHMFKVLIVKLETFDSCIWWKNNFCKTPPN